MSEKSLILTDIPGTVPTIERQVNRMESIIEDLKLVRSFIDTFDANIENFSLIMSEDLIRETPIKKVHNVKESFDRIGNEVLAKKGKYAAESCCYKAVCVQLSNSRYLGQSTAQKVTKKSTRLC